MTLMMACSCSLIPTKQIEVTAKPMDRTIVQPVMPREIDLKEPMWIVVTPDNVDEQLARIEQQEGEVLFLATNISPDVSLSILCTIPGRNSFPVFDKLSPP